MSVRSLTAVVIVGLVTLAVAGCGHGLSSGSATETPAPVDTQLGPDEPGTVVSWSEASSRVGQVITVEGPVVAARRASAGKGPSTVLIIGIGASDPGRFLAIIPYSLRANSPRRPRSTSPVDWCV